MSAVEPTYRTCPFCHTPVELDCYEYVVGDAGDFRVCPECDHAMFIARNDPAAHEMDPDMSPIWAVP
jgi:hypothetical protein